MILSKHTQYTLHGEPLCAQTDPEAFFPETGQSARPAKSVCKNCPVQAGCLIEAIANDIHDGIWGGLAPRERQALAKEPSELAKALAKYQIELRRTNETMDPEEES